MSDIEISVKKVAKNLINWNFCRKNSWLNQVAICDCALCSKASITAGEACCVALDILNEKGQSDD